MKKKLCTLFGLLTLGFLSISSVPAPENSTLNIANTGHMTYSAHRWSFIAYVVRMEEVSVLGSHGHAALLTYLDERKGNANYVWALLDLDGYDYHPADGDVQVDQEVLVFVSGHYVDERGIDYDQCSNEAGDYCTILTLVEGAYPKSIDMYNLPISPGNELIHHGSSSRNWWNGMLAWKIAAPEKMPGNDQ